MDILAQVRERKKRSKKSFKIPTIAIIEAIIDAYRLDDDFLVFLRAPLDQISQEIFSGFTAGSKYQINLPPFYLASKTTYLLARKIIKEVDNPYLRYSRDPLEIYLSRPLFLAKPSLQPEELTHHHFKILLTNKHQ